MRNLKLEFERNMGLERARERRYAEMLVAPGGTNDTKIKSQRNESTMESERVRKRKQAAMLKKWRRYCVYYLSAIVIVVIFTTPFFWMLSGSLKKPADIFAYPPVLIPAEPQFVNYVQIFVTVPIFRYLLNSIFVSAAIVIGGLFINSLAAYAFARLRFRGRDLLFSLVLATFMIPFQAIVIPLFIVVKTFGWIDTYKALIIPFLFNPFGIFLLRQFFLSIPKELEHAARIDGCSWFGIYFRIILPLSKPALAAFAIISFIWSWNELLWPLVATQSEAIRLIQVGVVEFQNQYFGSWALIMAASTVAIVPTLIVFLYLQKYFVQGISTTGIKG